MTTAVTALMRRTAHVARNWPVHPERPIRAGHYPPPNLEWFYGRGVYPVGEPDDTRELLVQDHDRRSYAALRGWLRHQGMDPDEVALISPTYAAFRTSCGCTPDQHIEHQISGAASDRAAVAIEHGPDCDADCDYYGLPPCRDRYDWSFDFRAPTQPGALPVLDVRLVGYDRPAGRR